MPKRTLRYRLSALIAKWLRPLRAWIELRRTVHWVEHNKKDAREKAIAYHNTAKGRGAFGGRSAVALYTKAILLQPDSLHSYIGRGETRLNLEDYQGAFCDASAAIGIDSKFCSAYIIRGKARHGLGDYHGAIGDYNLALELKPDYWPIFHDRGVSRYCLGDYQGALEDQSRAIELAEYCYGQAFLCRARAKEKLGDKAGAEQDYRTAYSADRELCEAYVNETLAKNPNDPGGYCDRAMMKSEDEDYRGAIADYSRAIKLGPHVAIYHELRAWEYVRLRQLERARKDFMAGAKLGSQSVLAQVHAMVRMEAEEK